MCLWDFRARVQRLYIEFDGVSCFPVSLQKNVAKRLPEAAELVGRDEQFTTCHVIQVHSICKHGFLR